MVSVNVPTSYTVTQYEPVSTGTLNCGVELAAVVMDVARVHDASAPCGMPTPRPTIVPSAPARDSVTVTVPALLVVNVRETASLTNNCVVSVLVTGEVTGGSGVVG